MVGYWSFGPLHKRDPDLGSALPIASIVVQLDGFCRALVDAGPALDAIFRVGRG
jgi:hypothetical protein